MTREEAIKMLRGMKADNLNLDDLYTKDKYEALDMAIKALEQEPEHLVNESGDLVKDLVKDTISRQTVLSKIKEVCFNEEWLQFRIDNGSNGQRDFLINYIEQLPPVTPTTCIAKVTFSKDDLQEIVDEKVEELVQHMESRWIPVSEKLPKSSGVYIVSRWFSDGEENAILTDANYYDGNGYWYNDNRINWGRDLVTDKIVAWMPLPKPYKAESEEIQ